MTSSGEDMPSEEMEDELPPLLQAARNADVATFKKMIEDGVDVLQKDEDDRTVLHWAAQSGCVAIIMTGVTRGLMWHVNAKSKRGLTPLHEACLAGYVRTVHVLMSLGANMEAHTQEGYTPLLCAAGNGHNDITRILVGGGCDPNKILPGIGVNALHIAAWTDQPEVLADLLIMGGDINKKSMTRKTAMEFALEQNHTDCVTVLKKHEQKLQEHFKHQLSEQENFFRTKLNLLADKIHKYYDDRLKQEMEYFEQQLQDQHDKDAEVILKLKSRIDHMLKTELDDDEDDDDEFDDEPGMDGKVDGDGLGTGLLRPDRTENSKMALRRRRRSSQFAHRPRMFSITAPHGPGVEHESSDDEHVHGTRRRYDRQISVDGHRQPRRPGSGRPGSGRAGSGKAKSMTELVDDISKKRSSVNFVKRQESTTNEHGSSTDLNHNGSSKVQVPGVPTIRLLQPSKPAHPRSSTPTRTRSTTPSHQMSFTPSNSSISPSPPPPSPISHSPNMDSMSPTPSNVSTSDSVFVDGNENQLTSPKPKSRRSSIAAFLRPHFKANSSVAEEEKSRRRSVETKVSEPKSPAPPRRKPRKKGFSLFSFPLPGIPSGVTEEDSFEDVEMGQSGSH